MRIGIFIFKGEPEATTQAFIAADLCLASIRRTMPGVHVTQLTDDQTPEIPGVDKVLRRVPTPALATLRTFWQSSLDGDWVFCDADVVFQEDVRPVFEQEFDVALASRMGGSMPAVKVGDEVVEMPHNVGVVYSKSKQFWTEIHTRIKALPLLPGAWPRAQADWFADQIEVNQLAKSGAYKVLRLPARFNYAPEMDGSDALVVRNAAVVHYKGPQRKRLMMERARQEYGSEPVVEQAPTPKREEDDAYRPLRVFIGYDPRQPLAHNVAAHSVATRAKLPVSINRLQLNQLPITARGLTEFTFSRFLVPWLCGFKGYAVFLDADVLCLGDIGELARGAWWKYPEAAVHVVGHQGERAFERASVMVFDNEKCRVLTPEYVEQNAKKLLGFGWADGSVDLGLPKEWNHLVGYDPRRPDAKLVHFTMGVPCWPETQGSEYAAEWRAEWNALQATCTFDELMGKSVHVPHLKAVR